MVNIVNRLFVLLLHKTKQNLSCSQFLCKVFENSELHCWVFPNPSFFHRLRARHSSMSRSSGRVRSANRESLINVLWSSEGQGTVSLLPALHKSILTPELGWSGRQGGNYQDYIKVNTNPGLVGDILSSCQYNQWRICVNGRGNVGKYPTYPDKCIQCSDHGASTLRWWCELWVTCEQQQWEYLGVARSRKLAQREARQPGQQVNINKYYEPGLQPHPGRALDIQSAYSDGSLFYHLCDKM